MNPLPSLEEIMDCHAPALLRYAERLVRNPHSAQDVVQQVFVRFSRLSANKKPSAGSLKAWLYRSTHNQAIDLIRAEQRRKKLHEAQGEHTKIYPPESKNLHQEQKVLDNLHRLKNQEQQVLLLRLQEGLSYKEISEVTGLKEGHIGYMLHQAVRTLSTHFQTAGEAK
jgi:RNA polymerase sigma-70 factor (ECF subfamily)